MGKGSKIFLIIDGNALVHRAYHALPSLATKKGELVNAVYGFLLVFLKAVRELHPEFIAAAFDLPFPTFRHERFQGYKAKRPKTPGDLVEQIPKVKEVLALFNVPVFEKEGFEADDLIGTISHRAAEQDDYPDTKAIILSGDLDTLQLIDEKTSVYTLRKGVKDTVTYDKTAVLEKYGGIPPEKLIDFKSLRGDPSDNIPGVPGVGEKTAIELIKKFGSTENLYQELEGKTEKAVGLKEHLREILLQSKDQAFFSKMLSEIRRDVPIDFKLGDCQWKKYDKGKVVDLLRKLEFYSLIDRLPQDEDQEPVLQISQVRESKLF